MVKKSRCHWCGTAEDYIHYHDTQWGVPVYDSKELFAKLVLDGQQAGLSWITILRKQVNYEQEFLGLDPIKLAQLTSEEIALHKASAIKNKGIVRNKLKISSVFNNAQAFVALEVREGRSFSTILWDFVGGEPIQNNWKNPTEVPTQTKESRALSNFLRQAGFSFVGPTIVYAFMQAVGMVNDHLVDCYRHKELQTKPKPSKQELGRALSSLETTK